MSSGEKSDSYIAAVAMQLQQTQSLIQTLLTEIRENSTEQAALNTELKNLRLNVNTLSNIIRGGDGNNKPLVLEVEMMKHADVHLDKRITAVVEDLEDQIISLAKNLSEAMDRVELADKQRRDWETAKLAADVATNNARLAADVATNNDLRLDIRTRFATKAGIVIAIMSMIGTILALIFK